jgi:hypothetical protein
VANATLRMPPRHCTEQPGAPQQFRLAEEAGNNGISARFLPADWQ